MRYLVLVLLLGVPSVGADPYDVATRTVRWVADFETAQARAVKQKRALLLKPVYRIQGQPKRWYRSCARLQAGPLSDPAVVALINRHFVACYFPVNGTGNAKALAYAKKANPKLQFPGGRSSEPPLMIFDPAGKLLLQIHNDAPAAVVREALEALLTARPKLRKADAKLARLTGRKLMRHLITTGDFSRASKLIDEALEEKSENPELLFLKGVTRCRQAKWDAALVCLDDLNISEEKGTEKYITALRLELAQRYRLAKKWVRFRKAMSTIRKRAAAVGRGREAEYYYALAQFRRGQKEDANRRWQKLYGVAKQDVWALKGHVSHQDADRVQSRKQFIDKKY